MNGPRSALVGLFVHTCDRGGIEPKSEQRLRSLWRYRGRPGLDDLLEDFAFGIKSTCLAHQIDVPLIGMTRQERECIAGRRRSELESRTDLGILCMSIVVTKESDQVRMGVERGRL
jgi:hypothetical protein